MVYSSGAKSGGLLERFNLCMLKGLSAAHLLDNYQPLTEALNTEITIFAIETLRI